MTSSHLTATFTFYHTVHTLSQSTNWKMLLLCGSTHINIFKHTTLYTHIHTNKLSVNEVLYTQLKMDLKNHATYWTFWIAQT